MGKIRKLMLMREAKQVVKIVYDKGSFNLIGDDGISPDYTEKELVDLLDKLSIPSYEQLIEKSKSLKTHQVEIEVDDKDVKKMNLK